MFFRFARRALQTAKLISLWRDYTARYCDSVDYEEYEQALKFIWSKQEDRIYRKYFKSYLRDMEIYRRNHI